MKKRTKLILKIIVSAFLFYLIYRKNDNKFSQVISNFSGFNFWYIPLILLLIVLNYILGAFRWKSLLIFENTEHISVKDLIVLYFKGAFFNNFMPSSIGGDVYKVYGLNQKIKNLSHSFASVFMDRFTGVLVLFLISLLSLPLVFFKYDFLKEILNIDISVLSVLLISIGILISFLICLKIGFWLLNVLSKKMKRLCKVYSALKEYSGYPKVVFKAMLISVLVQLASIFTQYFIFSGLGIQIDIIFALMTFPIIALISFLPISLNGFGVQDGLYKLVFSFAGISDSISLTASLFYHISRLVISLIGGVFYALGKDK